MIQETRPCQHGYYSVDDSTGGVTRCLHCGAVMQTRLWGTKPTERKPLPSPPETD